MRLFKKGATLDRHVYLPQKLDYKVKLSQLVGDILLSLEHVYLKAEIFYLEQRRISLGNFALPIQFSLNAVAWRHGCTSLSLSLSPWQCLSPQHLILWSITRSEKGITASRILGVSVCFTVTYQNVAWPLIGKCMMASLMGFGSSCFHRDCLLYARSTHDSIWCLYPCAPVKIYVPRPCLKRLFDSSCRLAPASSAAPNIAHKVWIAVGVSRTWNDSWAWKDYGMWEYPNWSSADCVRITGTMILPV